MKNQQLLDAARTVVTPEIERQVIGDDDLLLMSKKAQAFDDLNGVLDQLLERKEQLDARERLLAEGERLLRQLAQRLGVAL